MNNTSFFTIIKKIFEVDSSLTFTDVDKNLTFKVNFLEEEGICLEGLYSNCIILHQDSFCESYQVMNDSILISYIDGSNFTIKTKVDIFDTILGI